MKSMLLLSGDGMLVFKGLSPLWMACGLAGALILLLVAWTLQTGTARKWARVASTVLRFAAFALVLVLLMEPVLRKKEIIPQETFLVHAYDTSGSMKIQDFGAFTRLQSMAIATTGKAAARARLDEIFRTLEFRFEEGLEARRRGDSLEATEKGTDLSGAFQSLAMQVNGLPISGVVLYSDGVPTINESRDGIIEAATQLQIPVYTVGCAPKTPGADFWIEKVIHPETVTEGVGTDITALVGTRGMNRQSAKVTLAGEGIKETQTITPSTDDQVMQVRFTIKPYREGLLHYEVQIDPLGAESYPWNNTEDFFIRARKENRRILYVEGAPRYEYRFLRAAFEEDNRFHVTSLITVTEKGQIYRQGLTDPAELKGGFPTEEKDLFIYDVVVIGDVSPQSFTPAQLKLLDRYVTERGGGLLYLAGKASADAVAIAGTPLEAMLPCRFEDNPDLATEWRVRPTARGIERAIFGPYSPAGGGEPPWSVLPPIAALFPLSSPKPGAVTLCEIDRGQEANPPVVAYQRYGRGVCLLCGISATWPWKFQVSSENPSYAAFWKEMMLILAEQTQERIRVEAFPPVASVGAEILLQGAAFDAKYLPDPTAKVSLEIEDPNGGKVTVEPTSSLSADRTFEHRLKATVAGAYKIKGTNLSAGEAEKSGAEAAFLIKEDPPELREIRLGEPLLREVASLTGGQYVHLTEYDTLPDKIAPKEQSLQRIHEKPVWDRLSLFAALLGVLMGEWLIRRMGNLA